MTTSEHPASWTDEMSGRERVRAVVETLSEPATVQWIADRAGVSRTTANDELERLASDNWVRPAQRDGKKAFDLNPSKLFFEELHQLTAEKTRAELEAELENLQKERETLQEEFEAESIEAFRDRLAEEDLSAEEIQDVRNVADTWEMLNSEITLIRHALRLYGDIEELSDPTRSRMLS